MTHIVAGYPSIEESILIGKTLIDAGTKYLEIQFPFLDPIADGPTIKMACSNVIKSGFSYEEYFEIVKALSMYSSGRTELICMSYYNPILNYKGNFYEDAISHGIEHFIIPDLSYCADYTKYNLIPVISSLISPEYFNQKNYKSDLIYCVSGFGVTGQTKINLEDIKKFIVDFKSKSHKKIYLGFGIKSLSEASLICEFADGAVIGSQIIKEYQDSGIEGVQKFLNRH